MEYTFIDIYRYIYKYFKHLSITYYYCDEFMNGFRCIKVNHLLNIVTSHHPGHDCLSACHYVEGHSICRSIIGVLGGEGRNSDTDLCYMSAFLPQCHFCLQYADD